MTTVRAASSAMLSVASVPRRAAVLREAPAQEVAAREAAPRAAVLLQGNRTVAAVAPAVMMTTITTHLAAVAEAVGDDVLWDTLRVEMLAFGEAKSIKNHNKIH